MITLGFIDNDKPKCNACGLHKEVITEKFPLSGKGKMEIMLIFDKPSEMENATGKKFVGQQYTFLEEILAESGISLKEDCWKTHAINCSFQRKLTDSKIKKICEYCSPYPTKHLKEKKPKLIICFGGYAASVVLKSRFSDTSAGRWRGLPFWSPEHSCYVMVTYDPSKLYDSMDSDSYRMVIENDVRTAIKYLRVKPPKVRKPKIETSINYREIVNRLAEIYNNATYLSMDFETNALKPDNPDKKIVTCSYTYVTKEEKKKLKTFSFIVNYRDIFSKEKVSGIHFLMRKIALKRSIKKIAHHLKFEENWSRKILGISESKGWIWCTMYTAHVLDERKKFVGLKFQSFLYFQAEAYEEELKKYLVPKIPGGNSLNTVDNAPVQDLLYYNGLDTYYTFLLFLEQRKQIQETPSLYSINKLFLDGALCFADMESTGFGVVPGYYDKATKEIEKDIRKTEKEILKTKECLRFKKKLKREFQFSNDKDIYTMIYDVMKTEKTKETKGGKGSTDAEVLMGLSKKGSEWAKLFLHHTKLCTANDTFISGMKREVSEHGRIHTFYHLHTTRTGRSCIAKGTKIEVVRDLSKNPEGISIEDVKEGDLVYCYDSNRKLVLRKVLWAGKTGRKKVIEIHWRSHGGSATGVVKMTPEHKIRGVDGEYYRADSFLKSEVGRTNKHSPRHRVLALLRKKGSLSHLFVTGEKQAILDHRFIYEQTNGDIHGVIHHKDGNHINNNPSNLLDLSRDCHSLLHSEYVSKKSLRKKIKALENNRWKIKPKYGKDNPSFLDFTTYSLLRLVLKSKGKLTKTGHCFTTIKQKLEEKGIKIDEVKLRFTPKIGYLTRGILVKASKMTKKEAVKFLGTTLYKIDKIYEKRGIPVNWGKTVIKLKRRNIVNNHVITSIVNRGEICDVYDLEIEEVHNFIAGGICVHNSSTDPNF